MGMDSKNIQDLVKANFEGVTADVAKSTGVAAPDVEKVMKQLGLDTALANRFNVSLNAVRISIGQDTQ